MGIILSPLPFEGGKVNTRTPKSKNSNSIAKIMTETKQKPTPPDVWDEQNHRFYLNDLRRSGVTNMFGATPYLMDMFPELSKSDAHQVLAYWCDTFDPVEDE